MRVVTLVVLWLVVAGCATSAAPTGNPPGSGSPGSTTGPAASAPGDPLEPEVSQAAAHAAATLDRLEHQVEAFIVDVLDENGAAVRAHLVAIADLLGVEHEWYLSLPPAATAHWAIARYGFRLTEAQTQTRAALDGTHPGALDAAGQALEDVLALAPEMRGLAPAA